jgi:tetratricopeptide (TPR) repeat protein
MAWQGGMIMMQVINGNGIPLEAQYLYRKALSLSMEGNKEEALNDFRRAVFIAPRFCKALNAMGNCLDELERYDEAVRKFDKVIEIDPHHAEARLKREMIRNKTSFSRLLQQGR